MSQKHVVSYTLFHFSDMDVVFGFFSCPSVPKLIQVTSHLIEMKEYSLEFGAIQSRNNINTLKQCQETDCNIIPCVFSLCVGCQ